MKVVEVSTIQYTRAVFLLHLNSVAQGRTFPQLDSSEPSTLLRSPCPGRWSRRRRRRRFMEEEGWRTLEYYSCVPVTRNI